MVFVNNRPFSYLFFLNKKKPERNILWYSGWKIMLFGPQKWSSHKLEKSRHFAKGLVHGLSQKIDLFLIGFFLIKKSQKERFFDILDKNECFLDLKSEVLKRSKKSTFCKRVSPWFLSKNRLFSYMFFFSQKSQKETFFYSG